MKADLHIHSKYSSHALYIHRKKITDKLKTAYSESELFSEQPNFLSKLLIDGTSHVRNIMIIAKRRGLGCIAITDHNTTIGNLEAQKLSEEFGIIVVPAMELSTQSGEILCFGITKKIEKGLSLKESIKQVHDQGGIVVAAHPYNPKHPNIDFARLDKKDIIENDIDAIEVFNQFKGQIDQHSLELAEELGIGIIGGSDAHIHYQIGKGLTILPDDCKTYQDVVDAIKNRRTSVSGTRMSFLRVFIDLLWCNTLGRFLINRRWGNEF